MVKKCSSSDIRCRGKFVRAKNQVYWKSSRKNPCNGFYFEIKPKGGLSSNQKKSLYAEKGSKDFLRSMRANHTKSKGMTYSSSNYNKSKFLGVGNIKGIYLKPENTSNIKCPKKGGRRIKTQRRRSQRRGQRRTQRRR